MWLSSSSSSSFSFSSSFSSSFLFFSSSSFTDLSWSFYLCPKKHQNRAGANVHLRRRLRRFPRPSRGAWVVLTAKDSSSDGDFQWPTGDSPMIKAIKQWSSSLTCFLNTLFSVPTNCGRTFYCTSVRMGLMETLWSHWVVVKKTDRRGRMWGEALQSYDQIGIVKMSALLKWITKKWWNLPCWLFSTLSRRCRLLNSNFACQNGKGSRYYVGPRWTGKPLPLWLCCGSKSLVATCKTEPLSLLGCPSCRPVTDRMVTWRKITLKVKVEVKAAEVQEAHCGVTWKKDGRSDGTMRSYILMLLMIDADFMNTQRYYIAIYVYNNDKMIIIHIGIRRWKKWLPYLRSSSQEASQSLDLNLRSGMGCWWHVHLERPGCEHCGILTSSSVIHEISQLQILPDFQVDFFANHQF